MNIIKNVFIGVVLFISLRAFADKTRIINTLESDDGHSVLVSEYTLDGQPETHLLLNFQNLVCIKDVIRLSSSSDILQVTWTSGSTLQLAFPKHINFEAYDSNGFLQCADQKVKIVLEVK